MSDSLGSSVHGVLQARILQWVPFPSPGDLLDPGIEPGSLTLQADSLPSEPAGKLLRTLPGKINSDPRGAGKAGSQHLIKTP